ncbi:Fic family protein [Fluviibacter phosphoraccumulans]|uniref:Fic family protein n=1 Tax=Fluviibacter phosphoraccumulans TaxID=1751046 RepID=UPI0024E2463B|nr:Fic/DOC family N-terminal domain-containing protein [Fluviibacter phosphoraccumulans]
MQPYAPTTLPPPGIDIARLVTLVGEANAALARYDGLLHGMVNPAIMLSPLTNQEAVLSSRIEGTQATVEEVLEHEAGQEYDAHKQADIQEILNYRHALTLAADTLRERPLGLGLVKALHKTLMDSVRGQDKEPGEFRKTQNWIGPYGCTRETATFVPPNPLQLPGHLEAWERYLESDDVDPLLQTAIVHAQFEILHPFKDGNGRIGRLLIPLFLYSKGRLSTPMFYLSAYLEASRPEYYARLAAITRDNDWTGWTAFFLRAIAEQAKTNIVRVQAILALYERMKTQVRDITRSQHSAQIVDALFERPIFRIGDFATRAHIPKPTAHPLLKQLQEVGLLKQLREGAGRRPAILAFPELLNIAEGRAEL